MKINNIKALAIGGSVLLLASCTDNSWNDTFLDGFTDEVNYDTQVTAEYTLSTTDYETIGKALASIAVTDDEVAAAKAIQSNHYFDQLSPYPAQVAVPYLLNKEQTNFYAYNEGSYVNVTLLQAETPAEITAISAAPRLVIGDVTAPSALPGKLAAEYPDAVAGDYAIVSYNNGSSSSAPKAAAKAYASRADITLTSNIKNLSKGETLTATAVVTGQSGRGLVLTDNAGSIFYYMNNVDLSTYAIGTVVEVSGTVDVYGTGFQLPSSATLKVVGTQSYSYPSPTPYTAAMISEAISSTEPASAKYISIEGEMSISNNYYNINIPGVDNGQGSLYTPTDALKAKIENGKSYTFIGYFTGVTSGKYFYMVITDVKGEGTGDTPGGDNPGGDNPGGDNPGGDTPGLDALSSSIKDLKEGDTLTATAAVTGQCTRGLILTDNAGSILYYNTSVTLTDYPIGTIVNVSGEIGSYNKGFQLSNTATLAKTGILTYEYPTPTAYTAEMITQACAGTTNQTAKYVSIEGSVAFSNNYTNIIVNGTSVQGSAYYILDELKAQLNEGSTYRFYGYFTSFTSSYFYVVVTDVEEIVPEIDENALVNAIYQYNGSTWVVADNAVVMNPSDYTALGLQNNKVTEPAIYLPLYMKNAYPYTAAGTEKYVAYNLGNNMCSCALLTYDGNNWTYVDSYIEEKVAAFQKTNDGYKFRKYIGEEVFTLYEEDTLALNCSYLIVYGGVCMEPVPTGKSYGYPGEKEITISDGSIVMPNGDNAFTFTTTTEYNGNTYTTPEGYFLILDSNGRYMYLQGTYSSFNVRANNAYIDNDGTINIQYLFKATKNTDGTWAIVNTQGDVVRTLYYSDGNNDFAAYTDEQLSRYKGVYPSLYISESTKPSTDNSGSQE